MSMTPDERAARAAAVMHGRDQAAALLGLELVGASLGRAEMALTVDTHHCNGHGTCHGGVTYALADTAFAHACNSRNQRAVAQSNSIAYLVPVHAGDRLTAQAREISLTGRSGIYDVAVINQAGQVVALFRGISRTIAGTHFDESAHIGTEGRT